MNKFPLSGLVCSAMAAHLILGNAYANDQTTRAEPPQVPEQVRPKVHPLAESVTRIGGFACVERANQIAMFLDPEVKSQSLIQTPASNPNRHLLMSAMVIPLAGNTYALGAVSLAPNQASGCDGSYHVVSYADMSCDKAREKNFPNVKFNKMNQLDVSIAVLSKNLWVITIPAGSGCLLLKEELISQ
jgi:hypothetical protein